MGCDLQNRELQKGLQRIERLIEQTQKAAGDNIELQAHWGRYLCVLVAGFLENALREIYSDFAQRAASGPAARFIANTLAKIMNPKAQRFTETAGRFKPEWASELDRFLADSNRKDAIDTIINNRHQIAHGKEAGINVVRVRQCLDKCVEVVEFLESQCGHGGS